MTDNRFDFLRLIFATIVALYHAVTLSAINQYGSWETILAQMAEISIHGFFIISGCLVFGSLLRSKTITLYIQKRIRRLYPAYCVIIFIPALFALFLTGQFKAVMNYIIPNLFFLNFIEPTLPGTHVNGLFENYNGVINGALWTLKIEVIFYMILPIIWWVFKRLPRWQLPLISLMIIAAEIWRYIFINIDYNYGAQIARQLPGQMGYFAIGLYFWLNWESIQSPKHWWLFIGAIFIFLSFWQPILHILRPLGLGFIIAWIAFVPGPKLNAARYGDMSYGIYITHFPIIQSCISLDLFSHSLLLGLFVSLAATLFSSFILWHWVEKPFLFSHSHYRRRAYLTPHSKVNSPRYDA